MKTAEQREQEFRQDLAALLEKHGAEVEITDDRKPYGLHSGVCVISMQSVWDDDANLIADYTEFRL